MKAVCTALFYQAKMPRAKGFKRWVTANILPTLRRTGGYVANEDMFIENYLPFLDEPYRNLFRLQMMAIGKLNERIRHDEAAGGVCQSGVQYG